MNEDFTPVNDGQVSDEGSQTDSEAVNDADEAVNAADSEATSGEQQDDTAEQDSGEAQKSGEEEAGQQKQTREENSQFAKVRREAEARVRAEYEQRQAARDTAFAQKAAEYGWVDSEGNPITTEESYWAEVDKRSKIDNLVNSGTDIEVAKALVENEQLKNRMAELQQKQERDAKQQEEYNDFYEFFKEVNGREFSPSEEIPQDVFTISVDKHIPLKYAYAEYVAKAEVEAKKALANGKKTAEVNAGNANASTGSVTGSPASDVITEAEIDAHANDVAWMNKNYKKVEDFYRKQKG